MRRAMFLLAAMAPAILVAAGVAIAVEKTCTNSGETLRGTAQRDILYGRGGNDRLLGLGGNDELLGGSGNDTVQGSSEADELYGISGSDTMNGGDDNDGVYGGVGDDPALFGGGGTDDISGGWGDDKLNSRDDSPNDSVSCGPNQDIAIVDDDPTDPLVVPWDKVSPDCEDVRVM